MTKFRFLPALVQIKVNFEKKKYGNVLCYNVLVNLSLMKCAFMFDCVYFLCYDSLEKLYHNGKHYHFDVIFLGGRGVGWGVMGRGRRRLGVSGRWLCFKVSFLKAMQVF